MGRLYYMENTHGLPAHKLYEDSLCPSETKSSPVKGILLIIHEETTYDTFVCVTTHAPDRVHQFGVTTD